MLRRDQWEVFEAADGAVGLSLAFQHRPDVILCDLLMPRVNGYQVCRAVRDHLELRHTKIIVVTGRDYAADRKSAGEAGADDYLVKPIAFEELRAALAKVVPPAREWRWEDVAPTLGGREQGVRLKFWGVRGSIPSPGPSTVGVGGNTSCVELRADGEHIICDAGSGIRPLGLSLLEEAQGRPVNLTLLITHTHWDHIQGFPFFLPAYNPKNRIRILGYEGARDGLRSTLSGQMESAYFPVALEQMPAGIEIEELKEMRFRLGTVVIEACFTNHPGVCVGYRFQTSGGVVIYMPDNETQPKAGGNAAPGSVGKGDRNLLHFLRDADVLILDSQYDAEEYKAHVGWGHGCIDEVVALALSAGVKQLYLFHHDPAHDDRFVEAMVEHGRRLVREAGGSMGVDAAREGAEVVLPSRVAVEA